MKPRLVGINHVALQVDDLDEAVAFYSDLFQPTDVNLSVPHAAFLRMGDQFIALFERGPRSEEPHFGLVVDDKEAVRAALEQAGIEILPGRFFDVRDPSGNRSRSCNTTRSSSRRPIASSREWGSSSGSPSRRWQSSAKRASPTERRSTLTS